ncbi:MAG: HDOD domain-containing protein [Gammaproteobacteria bacterium]
MHLAARLHAYLEQRGRPYVLIPHPPTQTLGEAAAAARIEPRQLARAVLLQDADALRLAVLPASHLIDFQAIHQRTGHHYRPAAPQQVASVFSDCEPGSVPPLAEPYGLTAILDAQLAGEEQIYFEAGCRDALVSLPGAVFRSLHAASLVADIARPLNVLESRDLRDFMLPDEPQHPIPLANLRPVRDIRAGFEQTKRLPPMPTMASRLLRLHASPSVTTGDLIEIIQADPGLTVQLLRYARAGCFGFTGRLDTLPQAISQVLGLDTALHMALGLAASRTLRNPADGPLGLQAFWRHAAYSAALAQILATASGPTAPLKPGLAYLAGLLHNFGFLLAGHLFRAEFFLLNRVVAANPQLPVSLIERRVLGVEHTELGASLMSAWQMPEAVTIVCREHHNAAYTGDQAGYVQLMYCVDLLLRGHGIGEGADAEVPAALLASLGLDPGQAQQLTIRLLESRDALDAMARQLAS